MTPRLMPVLVAVAALSVPALGASELTADELIAKNLEARGGAAKLRALTTMHTVGKQRLGGGQDAKIESWAVASEDFRGELTLQGMTAVQAWDGQEAWTISPFGGRREPQKISLEDAKALIEASDIAGPLVDYRAKGSKVEYLGTEDIDGTDAYKLRVTLKNGDTKYVYLDPDQYLEIRIVSHRMVRGQEEVSSTDLGDYEKVDGIYFPFESGRSQLDTVELNSRIDKTIFAFPGGAR
jgi:hypothetical protein